MGYLGISSASQAQENFLASGIIKKQSVQLSCVISRNIVTPAKARLGLLGLTQQLKEQIDESQMIKLLQVLEILHHCSKLII